MKIPVVHCWSAPRSRSTALLYSFEAREDCVALDEPLYREWLVQQRKQPNAAVDRPYRDALIAGVPPPITTTQTKPPTTDEERERWQRELLPLSVRLQQAAEQLIQRQNQGGDSGIIFCKHMAKHYPLYDFDNEVAVGGLIDSAHQQDEVVFCHKHVFLLRDPVAVLTSWNAAAGVHGHAVTTDEVGIIPLLSIYSQLQSRPNTTTTTDQSSSCGVVVLDSDTLVADPVAALQDFCQQLDIVYRPSMMTWPSGPHACDGPWAPWWYHDVHQSTGWKLPADSLSSSSPSPHSKRYRTLDPSLLPALRASLPAYQLLQTFTTSYRNRGPPPDTIYEDVRNQNILVYIGTPGRGRIIPRDMAGVNPFDSAVQGGDAVWEGLRVYRGKILSLDKHLRRLFDSAKALAFANVHTRDQVMEAIFQVLAANGMRDGAHMRLTLTRGEKCTSSMNPKFNVYGTTLIILPEWKPTEGATTYDNTKGIALLSASQRRNPPHTVDSKIHHNNLINNIMPKIQANWANCADAIMLDVEGYVSETNATNIFMVRDGVLLTPHADHCLPGITRATVLELAKELGIVAVERRISLMEFYCADEVFTTGTMGELTPVTCIDGRVIGPTGQRGPITQRLQDIYRTVPERGLEWATPIPEFLGP